MTEEYARIKLGEGKRGGAGYIEYGRMDIDMLMTKILTKLAFQSDVSSGHAQGDLIKGAVGEKVGFDRDFLVRISGSEGHDARPSRGADWYADAYNGIERAEDGSVARKINVTLARKRWLIREALDELKSLRISARTKIDVQTREGRMAVGLDTRPIAVIAAQYGYHPSHVHNLRAWAKREKAAEDLALERVRYHGTLEERLRIAAEPGSAGEVAARYDGVSQRSIQVWRRDIAGLPAPKRKRQTVAEGRPSRAKHS